MPESIRILVEGQNIQADRGIIIAPVQALENQALVRCLTGGEASSGKHIAYSLAQIAIERHMDGELQAHLVAPETPIRIIADGESIACEEGLLIAWTEEDIQLWAHEKCDVRDLLKVVHRACTRWIRLDVR